jgi:hypothetical protein
MKRSLFTVVVLLALLAGIRLAHAVPTSFTFTGRLASDGMPLDGNISLELALYDTASGGTPLWSESHSTIADNGFISVAMGGQAALELADFDGGDLWIAVTVNGTVLAPRFQIRSVPYAMHAAVCDSSDRLGNLAPSDVALASHNHDGVYAPVSHTHTGVYLPVGSTLSCGSGQKVTGLSTSGNVSCGADANTLYSAAASGGLSGTTAFSIADNGVTTSRIQNGAITTAKLASSVFGSSGTETTLARSDHKHDGVYLRNVGGGAVVIQVGAAMSSPVLFPNQTAFSNDLPVIVITPEVAGGDVRCWITRRDRHGFNYSCAGAYTYVHWIAIN